MYDERVRIYETAKRAWDSSIRKWLAEQEPKLVTEEDFKAAERRYVIEHREETEALEALMVEVIVGKAELERRWIEAHEDLAVLRKAGLLQRS